LNGRRAGGDLRFEIGNGGLSDAVKQTAEGRRLAVEKALYGCETFLGSAFNHVAGQSPRSGGKAEHRDVRTSRANDSADGFGEEASLLLRVEEAKRFDVLLGADRLGEVWSRVAEFQRKAHGFGRNENVGENDDGVHVEAAEGLKGDFGGEIGGFANLEKSVLGADLAVFGKIAAGLAHHPDRNARDGFSAAGTEEEFLAG